MKQKVEIMSMADEILSPITKASNVLLEDGSNVQQLIDNYVEPEFTPTIETSSSMSKVGQGDNVDFSANVINGTYESCVLKGKTLVNYNAEGNDRNEYVCMPSVEGESVTVNGTVEGLVKSAILKGQTLVNVIDCLNINNYTMKFADMTITDGYVTAPYVSGNQYITITKDKMPLLKANTEYTVIVEIKDMSCGGMVVNHSFLGSQKNIFTDTTTLTLKNIGIHAFKRTTKSELDDTFLSFCLHPTFNAVPGEITFRFMLLEGDYTNVDIPYFEGIQSVKMPVLTTVGKNLNPTSIEPLGLYDSTGANNNISTQCRTDDFISVIPNQVLTVSSDQQINRVFGYDKDGNYLGIDNGGGIITYGLANKKEHTFTVPNNCYNIKITSFINTNTYFQIEEGTQATSYEPYKSNILTVNEDVELGSVGEVKDELDLLTGKISQRTDIRPYQEGDESNSEVLTDMTNTRYKLAQEVVKTVDLSDNHVYSYKDVTHYDCSSEEGSLIPTLTIEEGVKYQAFIKPSTKYSIVFNRTVASDSLTVDLGGATANVSSTTIGKTIVQITTLPTLSHSYVKFLGVGNAIKDVQVIEGDVADDVEYFEGMIDVENPVVTNCNMLDVDSVDYKSNTISTNEVVLRSLPNGVCDTLDLMSGEYVQRVGVREYQVGDESNSQVSTDKVNTQYQLATPFTTIIDLKQHPFAYKDGHINLSSNSEKSLTPSIEYSLPINRSGQVTINTQLVQKQQKQLDELESMIIANMVNTQYKQTLSSVEYMLGGE